MDPSEDGLAIVRLSFFFNGYLYIYYYLLLFIILFIIIYLYFILVFRLYVNYAL
jgi:hypothetical protein